MADYSFALFYDFFLDPFLKGIRKKTARMILQLQPQSLVDICCGTGRQLKYFRNQGIELTGVDLSQAMLKRAKGVHCVHANAKETGLPENTFDAALLQLSLHEKSQVDRLAILKEIHRILKPDGYLTVVDYEFNKRTKPSIKRFISVLEFVAGKQHFRYFKDYQKRGYIHSLIDPDKFELHKAIAIAGYSFSIRIYSKRV